jgi:hypothetical protein
VSEDTDDELVSHLIDLEREIEAWRACARYQENGAKPILIGWDHAMLERCRHEFIEKETV